MGRQLHESRRVLFVTNGLLVYVYGNKARWSNLRSSQSRLSSSCQTEVKYSLVAFLRSQGECFASLLSYSLYLGSETLVNPSNYISCRNTF